MYGHGGSGDYANGDNMAKEDDRKLFIGGLSWETGDADIKEYFSRFGDVESVNLKTDPSTGRSRGFAFVVFTDVNSVEAVLNAGDLVIGNKKVEAKRAKARPGKIFVGGIPAEVSDEEIRNHFSAFGTITEVETPYDKVRNQRKGFVFITFESEASMKSLLHQGGKQVLGGKEVDVKKATPRNDQFGPGRGGMRGGPMGMRGGPMGMMGRGGRGTGPPGRGSTGGWGWGAGQAQTQQQWGGYGAASGGYDAYGYGGYGAGGGGSYGYSGGYGDGYSGYGTGAAQTAASGSYGTGTAAPAGTGPGRGGGARYQPY